MILIIVKGLYFQEKIISSDNIDDNERIKWGILVPDFSLQIQSIFIVDSQCCHVLFYKLYTTYDKKQKLKRLWEPFR